MAFNYPFLSREFATVKRVPFVTVAFVNTGTPPVKHARTHKDVWDEMKSRHFQQGVKLVGSQLSVQMGSDGLPGSHRQVHKHCEL